MTGGPADAVESGFGPFMQGAEYVQSGGRGKEKLMGWFRPDILKKLMTRLEPPDTHHLSAAVGWLELGNPAEAGEEIARISPAALEHPDVLEVRWQICANRS